MADSVRLETTVTDPTALQTAPSVAKVSTLSATNDPRHPDFRCSFHTDQTPRWCMVDSLMGGTETMRAAGETYLPRFDNEAYPNWQRRLERAVLLNYFRKTIMGYTGKPFGKPVLIPEDMPDQVKEVLEDVDGEGTNFHMFAQAGFEKGLSKGIVHALVDYPEMPVNATANEEAMARPIVTLIEPESLIGARKGADGDLDQIRIYECVIEPKGEFGEQTIERVRVIERDTWRIYRKAEGAKRWVVESSGVNSLGRIALATFRTDITAGFMRSNPPFMDLAFKNVEHWQSASDQRNILTVSRFPILVGRGVNPADPLTIGPMSYIGLREVGADLKFVEHGGQAISAGRQDLEDLKAEMAVMGLALLMPQQTGAPTATAKAIDGAESVTELQRLVGIYENFLNEVAYWIALWSAIEETESSELPKVRVNDDYAKLLNMEAGVSALLTARAGRDISRSALIAALKRRNILPPDFSEEEDADAMAEESGKIVDGMPPKTGGKVPLLGGAEDVAKQALNGAQVTSLMEILTQVSAKTLAPEAAIIAVQVAFPTVDSALAKQMVTSASSLKPPEPPPAKTSSSFGQ